MYADDVDMIFSTTAHINEADPVLAQALGEKHLTVNPSKKEQFQVPMDRSSSLSIKKLGSKFLSEDDLKYRIQRANHAFSQLWRLWKSRIRVSLELRIRMYNAFIKPILMYNAGSLDLSLHKLQAMDCAHRRHLRRILGIFYPNIISNTDLYQRCNTKPISADAIKARWTLLGHILRLPETVPAHQVMIQYFTITTPAKSNIRNILPKLLNQDLTRSNYKFQLKSYTDLRKLTKLASTRSKWQVLAQQMYDSAAEESLDPSTKKKKKRSQTMQIDVEDSDPTAEPPRKRPRLYPEPCPQRVLFSKFKKRVREVQENETDPAEDRPSKRVSYESGINLSSQIE
jgi:hypothetical protein